MPRGHYLRGKNKEKNRRGGGRGIHRHDERSHDDPHMSSQSQATVKAAGGGGGDSNNININRGSEKDVPNDGDTTGNHGALITMDHFDALLDREIEEEEIEHAIDSLWLDLLGIYLDCTMMKENLFMRGMFAPNHHKKKKDMDNNYIPSDSTVDLLADDSEEIRYHQNRHHQQLLLQQKQQRAARGDHYNSTAHPSWFEEASYAYGHMDIKTQNSYYKNKKKTIKNSQKNTIASKKDQQQDQFHDWNQMQRNFRDSQAPLSLSTQLCERIADLPERNVTLYIRLDEQVPHNSCTAYQVDWDAYLTRYCRTKSRGTASSTSKKSSKSSSASSSSLRDSVVAAAAEEESNSSKGITIKDDNNNELFTVFRLCSRPKTASRTECIVGTLASACLYPYTVVIPPMAIGSQTGEGGNLQQQQKGKPFRPLRLLLDRPEDVCTGELQFYLRMMGLSECQEVSKKLRHLHDVSELDFFPSNRGCDFLSVPAVATVFEDGGNNLKLVDNVVYNDDDNNDKDDNKESSNDSNGKKASARRTTKPPGTCTTSLPFMFLDGEE